MVYTLIDHRNDAIKCSKLCSEITRKLQLIVQIEAKKSHEDNWFWRISWGIKGSRKWKNISNDLHTYLAGPNKIIEILIRAMFYQQIKLS